MRIAHKPIPRCTSGACRAIAEVDAISADSIVIVSLQRRVRIMPPADQLTVLEEFSFRRIANAGVKASMLRPDDLQHLLDLGLAAISEGRAVLTEVGRARFAELQRDGEPDLEGRSDD